MNTKNRGFSLLIAISVSLILMSVSVGIITSISRTLDQVNNIARANQTFFATESAYENALFHHGVRGAGLMLEQTNAVSIPHDNINAEITWSINGRDTTEREVSGTINENEKITIPLYWDDSTDTVIDDFTPTNVSPEIRTRALSRRRRLNLSFSDQQPFDNTDNDSFDFGTTDNNVLFVWSVSRIDQVDGLQTFIPMTPDPSDPCAAGSSFYCKSDFTGSGSQHFTTGGVISFADSAIVGEILPGNISISLRNFMYDANSSLYEISFQPVLPFTSTANIKKPHLYYKLDSTLTQDRPLPKNIFDIDILVSYPDFEKATKIQVKETPSVGAFDYLIFK